MPASLRLPPWAVSWLQVSPLAFVLVVLFALPTLLFLVVSFFDYDRTGIYPAFILDNYRDLLTTPATIRVYVSSLSFAVIVWAITLFLGFNIAHFLIFHVRSAACGRCCFCSARSRSGPPGSSARSPGSRSSAATAPSTRS